MNSAGTVQSGVQASAYVANRLPKGLKLKLHQNHVVSAVCGLDRACYTAFLVRVLIAA